MSLAHQVVAGIFNNLGEFVRLRDPGVELLRCLFRSLDEPVKELGNLTCAFNTYLERSVS